MTISGELVGFGRGMTISGEFVPDNTAEGWILGIKLIFGLRENHEDGFAGDLSWRLIQQGESCRRVCQICRASGEQRLRGKLRQSRIIQARQPSPGSLRCRSTHSSRVLLCAYQGTWCCKNLDNLRLVHYLSMWLILYFFTPKMVVAVQKHFRSTVSVSASGFT
ncbi:unnamed protein product [Pylaiella littoralis]